MDAPSNSNLQIVKPVPASNQNPGQQTEDFSRMLMKLVGLKDRDTHAHSNRVQLLVGEWARHMQARWQWMALDIASLEIAALLHDVGKVGVLDEILLKPDALSAQEKEQLDQHAEVGYQLVRDHPGMSAIALGIRHHHERWDGKGYPLGLKEKQIPLFSQIIAIVDTYDAITSNRPYRNARSHEEALAEILRGAGSQFSTELVETFLQFMHARNT